MTPQDRELFQSLNARQMRLEEALAQLRADFKELERRAESSQVSVDSLPELPPLPPPLRTLNKQATPPPIPPFLTAEQIKPKAPDALEHPGYLAPVPEVTTPPVPELTAKSEATQKNVNETATATKAEFSLPPLPEVEPTRQSDEPAHKEQKPGGLEFQFGRWLARIGVVFALITLISFSTIAYHDYYQFLGPWSKLSVLAVISIGLVAAGLRMERRNPALTVYGRTLAGGGLACLYYTLYGATYVSQLQVIDSKLFGGILLLGWSAYVLYLAEKKKSELLSVFAIALAYFSSAITPVGEFTMASNLILSLTAVVFLVRNAWTGLSFLCLVGTYVGLLRQFVVYDSATQFWFEKVHGISFWPAAIYLAGAWIIYTAGVFLATTPSFAAGKRMAFLCLNNGALIGLLILVSNLSGFGHTGPLLCFVGGIFIATSYLARSIRADANEVAEAYLMQGLALATGGLVIAYTGVTRGLLITVESVFLAAAGAYARNPIFRIAAYVCALLGTAFLLGEINPSAAHPWVLIFGGAIAMLANALLARREFWHESREVAGQRIVFSSAYYVVLAIGLLVAGFNSQLSEAWAPPVMALTALVLTFSVYFIPLFELPLLVQVLLLFGLGEAVSPFDNSHPWFSEMVVGFATMILVAWLPRQKIIRTDFWLQPMMLLYALGMAALSYCAVHPHVDEQGWMISASLLSLGFLLYGIYARTWIFAVVGQILLAVSIDDFCAPFASTFPWAWWAAAVPVAVTFLTAWLVQEWLEKTEDIPADSAFRGLLQLAVSVYQVITLVLIVRLVFGLVPDAYIPLTFYALASALMVWNIKWPSSMGVRCGIMLDLFGALDYLVQVTDTTGRGSTWLNALGLVLLLAQPVLLRRWATALVLAWEIRGVAFLANLCVSLYVYWIIHPRVDAQGWMVAASLLSLIYLAYGAGTRMWQFMISGQVYLALAIWTFFNPPVGMASFPWAWWAAALPPAVVFLTGWIAHQWLPRILTLSEGVLQSLSALAYFYQIVALALVARWIFGIVPADEITLAFFALATGLLLWNMRWPSAFGARAGLVLNLVGAGNYLFLQIDSGFTALTWANGVAFTLFLAQPAILRRWGRELISEWESWAVILISAGMAWLFVSNSIDAIRSHNLTLGWALYALVLTVVGFVSRERRQRWCGLAILLAAIVRVGVHDFWLFSDLYKVLTFFVLTVICLGLSFLYYKFADRLKEWL